MLTNLLRNFELKCNQTVEEIKIYADLILRTENDIMISLKPRF